MVEANKDLFLEFLSSYKAMALSTVGDDGLLDCATVYYAYNSEGDIFFMSSSETLKSKNLTANNKVAIALHDGGPTGRGAKIAGTVSVVEDEGEKQQIRDLLVNRVADIKAFFGNPNLVYYKVTPFKRTLVNFAWGVDWRVDV